ncbi:pilin [Limosilactobacillus reuteri]|uniref:pilin n=1 Tax=Limosilactobacillus reuteri TaxID=1598 RepID=UPI001E43C7C5|nr:pilin [Limosilactobacillus reuteri]MCC4359267.1 pilin [Limosilactobacillus reuteri]MCC4362391.1 pilin [Limosilactobacillus reuteri]MCC4365697.1 pilin [Limosilactobacillus reuteri]
MDKFLMTNFPTAYAKAMNELTLGADPIGADPIGGTSSLLNKLSRGLMVILVAYAAFIVVWGAILYTSGGEESARSGKKKWQKAAVGLVVGLIAFVIVEFLKNYTSQSFGA